MSALGQRTETQYTELMSAAKQRRLSVDDIFSALRQGRISEDEAKELLNYLQKSLMPLWQRWIVGSWST